MSGECKPLQIAPFVFRTVASLVTVTKGSA